jgi:hypothetical protein
MAELCLTWQILADSDGNVMCIVEPSAEHWQE